MVAFVAFFWIFLDVCYRFYSFVLDVIEYEYVLMFLLFLAW